MVTKQHRSVFGAVDKQQIKLNNKKCKRLHVGKNNPEHKVFMDGSELEC